MARSYVTIQGDTWDSIAFRLWGVEHRMDRLYAANPDHADVLVFSAGVTLVLPNTPEKTTLKMELPPWM